jgi:nucleoside-diphosphate-sugar epimerase
MHVLILGCGTVGCAVGQRLVAAGHVVTGVRRSPAPDPGFPLLTEDAAVAARTIPADAILLAANPGVRRGRDNGLVAIAEALSSHQRAARVVYTGTTSVYADAAGQGVTESGAIAATPEVAALCAIEQALAPHPNHLVLRATALVGPQRRATQERIQAHLAKDPVGDFVVRGDPDRPFSYLHDDDLAALAVAALCGRLGQGILNAAAPEVITLRTYHARLAARLGTTIRIIGDGTPVARRWIDASRLQQQLPPEWTWQIFR